MLAGGDELAKSGADVVTTGGAGARLGGSVSIEAGSASVAGGSAVLKPGCGAAGGSVVIADDAGVARVNVSTRGAVTVNGPNDRDLTVTSGANMNLEADTNGTIRIGHKSGAHVDTVLRSVNSGIISHVPLQAPAYSSPSDRRIKREIRNVSESSILQRLQTLDVKKYRYTKEWQQVRGIGDIEVRGVIAQQVAQKFPEYIAMKALYSLPDKNFELENFHQVNKEQLAIDLLAALQATHSRFRIDANRPASTGSVSISSEKALTSDSASGCVAIQTGAAEGDTGAVALSAGNAIGDAGQLTVQAGHSFSNAGSFSMSGGSIGMMTGKSIGGCSGSVSVQTPVSIEGDSGVVSLTTGDSTVENGGRLSLCASSSAAGAGGSVVANGGHSANPRGIVLAGGFTANEKATPSTMSMHAGSSARGSGGGVEMCAGSASCETGGLLSCLSGAGEQSFSGNIAIGTKDATVGTGGLSIATGRACGEMTGSLELETGASVGGSAGGVTLSVGQGA
jgi:hypothetical protein